MLPGVHNFNYFSLQWNIIIIGIILETLVCNDVQESRINKLHKVMSEYIPDYKSWDTRLIFTQINARNIDEPDSYNKVITLCI